MKVKDERDLLSEIADLKQKLRESETIREEFVNASYDGYWDWHLQDNYEYMSSRFWEIFGVDPKTKKHHASEWKSLIFPEDEAVAMKTFQKHVQSHGKHPYAQEVRYRHQDGSTVTVLCRGKVIEWNEDGQPIRMIGSHTDVTAFKQIEKRILEQKSELELSNNELEQFVYVASHDLQAPIRHISSHLEILRDSISDKLSDDDLVSMKFVFDAADSMRQLISDLLELSRVGRKELQTEPVDMNQLIAEVKHCLAGEFDGVPFEFKLGKLPTVSVDRGMMKQVLINLLGNSIKYRRSDSLQTVKISARSDGDRWIFVISDNGVGFTTEDAQRIFQIFYRSKSILSRPGSGIGLAICKKIIEHHGGKIWADSKPNEGTTMHFTLKKD